MTVYSQYSKNTKPSLPIYSSFLFRINIALVLCATVFVVAHVVIANRIASDSFSMNVKQKAYHAISTSVAAEAAAFDSGQDVQKLVAFVNERGMIVNTNGKALFITSNVAFLP